MKIKEEIFEKLKKENAFELNPTLILLGFPADWQKAKINIVHNERCIILDVTTMADVKVNSTFDKIIALSSPEKPENTAALLKGIYINPSYKSDYLPKGYSGLCLIEFDTVIPSLLKKLKPYEEKIDDSKYDILYLTQESVVSKILNPHF